MTQHIQHYPPVKAVVLCVLYHGRMMMGAVFTGQLPCQRYSQRCTPFSLPRPVPSQVQVGAACSPLAPSLWLMFEPIL